MKYDDASWHYGGSFPKGLPKKRGATHIGMFLAWAIQRDLVGAVHLEGSAKELERVKQRKMTGATFLMDCCDEKLTNDELSRKGNAFAKAYFESRYLADYAETFTDDVDSLYELPDTWRNFDRLAVTLDRRYEAFLKKAKKKKKPATRKPATKRRR